MVTVPITAVVNYNLKDMKLEMKNDYDFLADMNRQIGETMSHHEIDFSELATFGASFTKDLIEIMDSIKTSDKNQINNFFRQLYKIF